MLLSDKIVVSYVEGFSGVYVYCEQNLIVEIAEKFDDMFETAWNQAMDDAEEEYDAVCQEKEDEIGIPASVIRNDDWEKADRLHIAVEPLYLSMNYGARADNDYGTNALEDTLKKLKEMYPSIRYEGVIAYEYSDEHCGDVVNYEISSEELSCDNTKTYDFIRNILNEVLTDEDISEDFWEKMSYQLDDADEDDLNQIIKDFRTYGVGQEHIDKLMEIAEEYGLEVDSDDDEWEDEE